MSKDKERRNGGVGATGEMERTTSDRPDGSRATVARHESMTPATWGGDEPFGLLRRFAAEMERVFDNFGFGGGLGSRGFGLTPGAWIPPVEVFRKDDRLVVRAELPGLNKDDVRVEIHDDALVIQGERRREQEVHRQGYSRSERSYGSFSRVIPLPTGIMPDKAEANFRDGVLEITMPAPRHEEPRGRQVEIKG